MRQPRGGEDRELARAVRVIVLEGWLAELPEREREILRLCFEEHLTQREIAQRLWVSQIRVSPQILRKSLERTGSNDRVLVRRGWSVSGAAVWSGEEAVV